MKSLLSLVVLLAVCAAGLYWWQEVNSACKIPFTYRIGVIDEGFGITRDGARAAVADAESIWENATGKNLFTLDKNADFTVNFVFDERQERTIEEHGLRDVLDRKENLNDTIKEQYDELNVQYDSLRVAYERTVAEYENALAKHNGEVAYWNNQGGAPPEEFERLNASQRNLDQESARISRLAKELNGFVDKLNRLGQQGNDLVEDYNTEVEQYNDKFGSLTHEFTQGDYQGDRINIYQFDSEEELQTVLAHELGHALGLGHVEGETSVMYYLMEEQPTESLLSAFDLEEFNRVCAQ